MQILFSPINWTAAAQNRQRGHDEVTNFDSEHPNLTQRIDDWLSCHSNRPATDEDAIAMYIQVKRTTL